MSLVVPLVLAGIAVLLMATFTWVASRRQHKKRVAPATTVGPRVLVHEINDDRCTGCDACVAVCPTNVLDLVANKSRVLRFQDCIQCEACMFACPTAALVMFPEGTEPPPLKVPEIDDCFQTVVPGQYLIGEVAGKPLVKNAANLGRVVVEHMLRMGLVPANTGNPASVDVAIVGSGPGGLSAALTCIQRGLSYVVLEKEQLLASTIARYPKGKLVMAEPYDTENLSLLPVFDASKEQLIPIWQELIDRVGLQVHRGESVEAIGRAYDGTFEIRSTVSVYRAQRVVLSIGTRGKPRTLQVPGENLPKVFNLLEDPDEFRDKWVCVVGGGDSACEAALALADAGARVIMSYRGKSLARANPRNKSSIEQYAAGNRLRLALGSQVLAIEPDGVVMGFADGTQQRYRNDAVFVLIGSDPPIAWLEQMGIRFVDRPHSYQLGKTDLLLRALNPTVMPCPEAPAYAAAQVLNQPVDPAAYVPAPVVQPPVLPPTPAPAPSGPKKWLQSATSIFATRFGAMKSKPPPLPPPRARPPKSPDLPTPLPGMPTPLYGGSTPTPFIGAAPAPAAPKRPSKWRDVHSDTGHHNHSGDGRRDQLQPAERTRILRMLRDDGGGGFEAVEDGPMHVDVRPSVPMIPDDWALPMNAPFKVSTHMPVIDEEQVHIGGMPPLPGPPPEINPFPPTPLSSIAKPASAPAIPNPSAGRRASSRPPLRDDGPTTAMPSPLRDDAPTTTRPPPLLRDDAPTMAAPPPLRDDAPAASSFRPAPRPRLGTRPPPTPVPPDASPRSTTQPPATPRTMTPQPPAATPQPPALPRTMTPQPPAPPRTPTAPPPIPPAAPALPDLSRDRSKPSKFVDAAKTEIASFEHLHPDAKAKQWPEKSPSTDPHVPDFDNSTDD